VDRGSTYVGNERLGSLVEVCEWVLFLLMTSGILVTVSVEVGWRKGNIARSRDIR